MVDRVGFDTSTWRSKGDFISDSEALHLSFFRQAPSCWPRESLNAAPPSWVREIAEVVGRFSKDFTRRARLVGHP